MKPDPKELRRVSAFQEASDEDLTLLVEKGILRSIEEGEFFFFQGDPAVYFYILVTGKAKLLQSNPSGQQVNLRTIGEWEMFGALGISKPDANYPATAQALESSTVLAIESKFMQTMLETRPQIAFGLMNLMTSYIQEMQARYRELATERVEQRVANTLIRLAGQSGTKSSKEAGIELFFSRQDVAEMTGSTLYTISRLLSEWERQGIIEAGRERIKILKPHDLVKIAGGLGKQAL